MAYCEKNSKCMNTYSEIHYKSLVLQKSECNLFMLRNVNLLHISNVTWLIFIQCQQIVRSYTIEFWPHKTYICFKCVEIFSRGPVFKFIVDFLFSFTLPLLKNKLKDDNTQSTDMETDTCFHKDNILVWNCHLINCRSCNIYQL